MFVSSLTLSAFWSRRMRCWKLRWWPALRPTCVYSTAVNGRRRPDAVNSKHGDVTMWQTFCLCGACLLGVMCFILNLFQELKRKYKETWYFIEHVTCISNALVPRLARFAASNVVFHLRYWWLDSNEEVSPFRGSANADYKMSGADRAVSVMCQWSEKVYAKYRSREIQFCDFEGKDHEITRFAFEREHAFCIFLLVAGLAWFLAQRNLCRTVRSGWSSVTPWRWEGWMGWMGWMWSAQWFSGASHPIIRSFMI